MNARLSSLKLNRAGVNFALASILIILVVMLLRNWRPSASDYPQQGIEASAAQGQINWNKAKADGVGFAYLLATSGDTERDARFTQNWQAATEANVRRGALHQFNLCRLARDQATNFIATVPREPEALPAAIDLDLEPECGALPARAVMIDEIATFIRMVEAHTEKPMIIRVSPNFEKQYAVSRAIDRPLWLTSFFFTPSFGERPWIMWRANKSLSIDGVDTRAGLSVLRP